MPLVPVGGSLPPQPFYAPFYRSLFGGLMGGVRDFFKRIDVFGSVGTTIGNTGQRLLDLRNEFNKIGEKKDIKKTSRR